MLVNDQKVEGETDLLEYVLRMSEKRRAEVIKTAWKVHSAKEVSERSTETTIDLLREYPEKSNCVCNANGVYKESVVEILDSNSVKIRKTFEIFHENIRNIPLKYSNVNKVQI